MNRIKLSIISEIIVLLIGALFLLLAVTTLESSGTFYKSAGFYPILLSSSVIAASAYALLRDLIKLRKDQDDKVKLGNPKSFAIVLGIMVAMQYIWKFLDMFYVSVLLGIFGVLYFFHDIGKPRRQRLIFAAAVSVGFTVVAYVVFTILLNIKF